MVNGTNNSSLPSYTNPPVIEVSFGIIFKRLEGMQSRHFGQFWSEHRDEYPTTEDLGPLFELTEMESQGVTLVDKPPLRRMMCYSPGLQFVAQIQDTRLNLNWRKLKADDKYPRYAAVHAAFARLRQQFEEFAVREQIGPLLVTRLELSYFNHIEMSSDVAGSMEKYIEVFKFSPVLKGGYISPPESVNAIWRFAMPSQRGTATATLNNSKDKDGKNILVMALTCTGATSEKYSETDWYESGHEWIVRSFTDLTTKDAHQIWNKE